MVTVTEEELKEFPEVELPQVDFDAEKVKLLTEVATLTRDAQAMNPFNQAAGLTLAKMARDLKEKVDKAQEDYKKASDEREAKILKKRKELQEKEEKGRSEEDQATQKPEWQPRDTLAEPIERRV